MASRKIRKKIVAQNELPLHFLRAVRNDGQMFISHILSDGENTSAIRRDLWENMNSHLNDPPMPPYVNENGVEYSNQIRPDVYKGSPGWEEL